MKAAEKKSITVYFLSFLTKEGNQDEKLRKRLIEFYKIYENHFKV